FPVQTSYKAFTTRWNWNEWLTLPIKFCELPRNALITLTVWDIYGPNKTVPVGGATVSVFSKYGITSGGIEHTLVYFEEDGDELCRSNHTYDIVKISDPEFVL
ncbi:hypothetical protein JTE90_014999, partial [Oedothorax gibbosus]